MIDLILVPVTVVYPVVVLLLFVCGINLFYLTALAWLQQPPTLLSVTAQLRLELKGD